MARNTPIAAFAVFSVSFAISIPASAAGAQQDMAVENFKEADANADGALTLNEFTALIDLNAADGIGRAHIIKRMGKQSMAFGRIDANSDGLISTEELSAMAANARR
ncbi:MAG: hypothetical protein AAGE80_13650 [Pseudomonadota bacterium]